MQPLLSFEQAPPISVPYRFFLTAPLFGAIAGMILVFLGAETLQSRWSQGALAMTHLIVVDFMLQAMCGSLLQFVAVVAGANIWRPRLVAAVVHPLITAGAVLLAAAFLMERPLLFLLAALVFATALGLFLCVMAMALLRTPAHGMSIHILRVAVCGLLVTLVIAGLIAYLFWWFIGFVGLPPPFDKVARVIVALVVLVFLVDLLLRVGGHPMLRY